MAKEKEIVNMDVSTYTADELIESYAAFGRPKECVVAALKCAKVKKATFDDAKAIVEKFMTRKVSG